MKILKNYGDGKLKLRTGKVHDVKGSSVVYIPKSWANGIGLKKGDKVEWHVDEDNINILHLKKVTVG